VLSRLTAQLLLHLVSNAHGADMDAYEAQIRSLQQSVEQEILVAFMGHGAKRYRPELEARLADLPLRFVVTAGGGWEHLEARRLLNREDLSCGVYITGGPTAELEVVGHCSLPAVVLEYEPIDPPRIPPQHRLDDTGEVATPRRLTATVNLGGLPAGIIRYNHEFRLGDRHGLAATAALSPLMGIGTGAGYRFYATGSFDRGVQLGVELGEMVFFTHERVEGLSFMALMTGFKHTMEQGPTIEIQAGMALLNGELVPNANLSIGMSLWPVEGW